MPVLPHSGEWQLPLLSLVWHLPPWETSICCKAEVKRCPQLCSSPFPDLKQREEEQAVRLESFWALLSGIFVSMPFCRLQLCDFVQFPLGQKLCGSHDPDSGTSPFQSVQGPCILPTPLSVPAQPIIAPLCQLLFLVPFPSAQNFLQL